MKYILLLFLFFLFKPEDGFAQNKYNWPNKRLIKRMVGKKRFWVVRHFGYPDSMVDDEKNGSVYIYATHEYPTNIKQWDFDHYIYWFFYFAKDTSVYRIEGMDLRHEIHLKDIDLSTLKTE